MSGRALPYPVPAVIAVVLRGDHVLLVRRANPPDAGLWGFPGGKIDYGETVAAAARRELLEETAIAAEAGEVLAVLDILDHDEDGRLRHHYILIPVLCTFVSGEPLAGDDALEVRWFPVSELDPVRLSMSADVDTIAQRALQASLDRST